MKITSAVIVTAFVTVLFLFALAGYQATTETAGERFLGRIGGALIEVDRWVPAHREDIDLLSRDRPEAPLQLPDFPMQISIPPAAGIGATDDALRLAVTQAMGHALYREGSGAIRDEEGVSHLSFTDPVRISVNMLGEDAHSIWRLALFLGGLVLLALCAGMVWMRQVPFGAIAIGGGLSAALSLLGWGAAQVLGGSLHSAVDREIALVLRDGAWIGIRNGVAFLAIGLAGAFVVNALVPRRTAPPRPEAWHDEPEWDEEDWEEPEPMESLPPRPPRF